MSKESRAKARQRSVDMSAPEPPGWEPSEEELALCESASYPIPLGDGVHQVTATFVSDPERFLVRFSLSLQTNENGRWQEIAEFDSWHGAVHRHQCGRSTDARVGEPEELYRLTCRDDVQTGYTLAHEAMMADWGSYKARWQRG